MSNEAIRTDHPASTINPGGNRSGFREEAECLNVAGTQQSSRHKSAVFVYAAWLKEN
jgi:hypothetical protein